MLSLFPYFFTYQQVAPFLLRVVLAFIFIGHGYPKLFNSRQKTTEFFDSIKIKPASFWTIIVGLVEFVSGILLLIGLFTQLAAILVSIVMLVAILKVKIKQGFLGGYDFEILILVCALSLLLLGPGIFSIDLPL